MLKPKRNIYKIVGRNVRHFRISSGYSQKELADNCDKTDRAKISDIENAKEDFMFSTLLEICEGLKIELSVIITDRGNEFYQSTEKDS